MPRAKRWLRRHAAPTAEGITYRSLLHIGEEWVRAAIVEVRPDSVLIIGTAKEPRIDIGPEIMASSLAPVCEDALQRAEDMTAHVIGQSIVPDEALLSISGGHTRSVTAAVQMARPEPNKEIGQREINRLLQELHQATEKEAAALTASTTEKRRASAQSLALWDVRLAEVAVDDHVVTSPWRFRGARLGAAAVALFVDQTVMEELHWLVTYLELSARLVAMPWALASAMSEQDAAISDMVGCVLDTRESTLFWLRRGTVAAIESCSHGSQDLLRDLGVSLGVPRFRADDLCQAYCAGELEEPDAVRVESGMGYAERQWVSALQAPFAQLLPQGDAALPAQPARLWYWQMARAWPGLEEMLHAWAGTWPVDRAPTVASGTVQNVPGVSDRTGLIGQEPADLPLVALAHHAGYLEKAIDPLNAALRRISLHAR